MKYFAKIEYVGTDFSGFQVQPDRRTVQGELCAALAQAFGAPCRVTGCSRTDRGVHAREF
jgi:tRNA pseudouridine38-40 synthase